MRIALIAGAALALAACGTPAQPAATSVAPVPKEYSCADQRKAGAELRALPPDAVLRRFMDDYRDLRIRLRALHNQPEPASCAS